MRVYYQSLRDVFDFPGITQGRAQSRLVINVFWRFAQPMRRLLLPRAIPLVNSTNTTTTITTNVILLLLLLRYLYYLYSACGRN